MHEIIIPMVPSRNLIGRSGWWRNSHNDRVVWRQRVADAVAGIDPALRYIVTIDADWQARSKPASTDMLRAGVEREVHDALMSAGLDVCVFEVSLQQSGRGQGETRLYLEAA